MDKKRKTYAVIGLRDVDVAIEGEDIRMNPSPAEIFHEGETVYALLPTASFKRMEL
ncbi:MAG: hypothetical protein PUJ57_01350 [Peptoniphilaceae bacterium]|nr:hypothetical protein [Peptoniphilaceae bacterium]MDY6085941.1 hypothetical protein [Peptoniphilaceae bacterium]